MNTRSKAFQAAIAVFTIVIIALAAIGAYSAGSWAVAKATAPKPLPPEIMQQYQNMNQEFVYAGKREAELTEKLISINPADPAIPSIQADIKKYQADRKRIQAQFNKLIADHKAGKNG